MKWPDGSGSKVWRGADAIKGAGGEVAGAASEQTQTARGGAGGGGTLEPCRVPGCLHDGLHAHLPGGVTVAGGGRGSGSTAVIAGGAGGGAAGYPGGGRAHRLTDEEAAALALTALIPGIPQGDPGPAEPVLPEGLAEDLRAILDAIALLPQYIPARELPAGNVLAYLEQCDCGARALVRSQTVAGSFRCDRCSLGAGSTLSVTIGKQDEAAWQRNEVAVRVEAQEARAWAAINEEAQRRGRALWADDNARVQQRLADYAAQEGLDTEPEPSTLTVTVGGPGEPSGVTFNGPAAPVDTHCGRCGRACGPEGHAVCHA